MNDLRPATPESDGAVDRIYRSLAHESARKHVSGEATYIDDIREPIGTQQIHPVTSTRAHARIRELDLTAVEAVAGVTAVLTAADIPGTNDFGHAGLEDDRVFAGELVEYVGQVIFAVVAETLDIARQASALAQLDYEDLEPSVTAAQALEHGQLLGPPRRMEQGDWRTALDGAPRRLSGRLETGAQDHFYLEGQVSLAIPKEDGDVFIYSSTQDPTAVQHMVARILDKPANAVTVEVRRLGGAFGGKETQATHFAAIAAVAALKTGRAAKCRLDRDDDMRITGKRHEFFSNYEVGYDEAGRIHGLDLSLAMRCGNSEDQSPYILDRALHHIDNAYFLENVRAVGQLCKTNTVSACAFRGFGTPQGFAIIERVIDEIAFSLDRDPLDVRKLNLYGEGERNVTPFGALVHDNLLPRLIAELEESSQYRSRRQSIRDFNAESRWLKKGIAFLPIKYGVGWGADFFEQAGALVHIYKDGSIHLNHGGTEMVQGLFVKCAQVLAHEFQVDEDRIKITSTTTDKVPNTTATAASTGTDFNGMAVQAAARKIAGRLKAFASRQFKVEEDQIVFLPNRVRIGNQEMSFDALIEAAYLNRISLSATGFYRTPDNDYDPARLRGQAHRYCAYGASVSEVLIDVLTGEHRVLRVDILHDVGRSINPAVDYGQLEGGFIQGMGWLTSEEVYWDDSGVLRTHAPSTYTIPACSDRPEDFRMKLVDWSENRVQSVYGSKAIGEPPLTLAVSVFSALTDAVASVTGYRLFPRLDAPATPERVLMAIEDLRARLES